MTKYIITGFSGFVSRHFLNMLEANKENAIILGLDINEPDFDYGHFQHIKCKFKILDLLQQSEVENTIFQFQPEYILHLASYSSVAFSWNNPSMSFANNTNIFLNLIEQVRMMKLKCRILSVGSSEEYGNVSADKLPLHEDLELFPVSPYAVARVSQEMLSKVYVQGYGMDIVMTRSFNHIGPWQKEIFVIPSFAKKLCEMKKHGGELVIRTGDLSIVRDFVDVRDVVKAYYMLLKNGKSGEIYNICSGVGTSLRKIVDTMSAILGIEVTCETDPSLVRPNDNRIIIGSNKKLVADVGWVQDITIENSLKDILEYWNGIV